MCLYYLCLDLCVHLYIGCVHHTEEKSFFLGLLDYGIFISCIYGSNRSIQFGFRRGFLLILFLLFIFIFGFLTIGLLLAVAQLRLHNNSILMNLTDFFFGSTLMIKIENWI